MELQAGEKDGSAMIVCQVTKSIYLKDSASHENWPVASETFPLRIRGWGKGAEHPLTYTLYVYCRCPKAFRPHIERSQSALK
jgi:hypothetical protein